MSVIEPIFKQALKAEWNALAPVIRAHYSLMPFTNQYLCLTGSMKSVTHSLAAKFFLPFASIVGALVPYRGTNIPVEVINHTQNDNAGFYWQRTFFFPGKRPFVFRSKMHLTGEKEITEYMRFGLGLRFKFMEKNGGLIYKDAAYVWKIGNHFIPLPINALIGKIYIEEMPVSEAEFSMKMEITHPVFGQTFQYNGSFTIIF